MQKSYTCLIMHISYSMPVAEDFYQILLSQLKELKKNCPQIQLAGLASGGAWIANRLANDLGIDRYGVINVSFHRDDYSEKGIRAFNSAEGMPTKLPFSVDGAHIILIDDVLDTGRTVAALNELFDYGRPAKVDLAVLVDRHRRQLPVDAAFKGGIVTVADEQILILELSDNLHFEFSTEDKWQR